MKILSALYPHIERIFNSCILPIGIIISFRWKTALPPFVMHTLALYIRLHFLRLIYGFDTLGGILPTAPTSNLCNARISMDYTYYNSVQQWLNGVRISRVFLCLKVGYIECLTVYFIFLIHSWLSYNITLELCAKLELPSAMFEFLEIWQN